MRAAVLCLVATVVLALMPNCVNHAAEMPRELHFELHAEESYPSGAPINVIFRLLGHPAQSLQVLKWNTPLEGIRGKIFLVSRDGVDIPYRGRIYKRGDPAREDYALLSPGGELRATVDLASAYDFTQPGEYRVTLVGGLADAVPADASLPRRREQFTSMALVGESVTVKVRPGR